MLGGIRVFLFACAVAVFFTISFTHTPIPGYTALRTERSIAEYCFLFCSVQNMQALHIERRQRQKCVKAVEIWKLMLLNEQERNATPENLNGESCL